jgi:hypothetical protein
MGQMNPALNRPAAFWFSTQKTFGPRNVFGGLTEDRQEGRLIDRDAVLQRG